MTDIGNKLWLKAAGKGEREKRKEREIARIRQTNTNVNEKEKQRQADRPLNIQRDGKRRQRKTKTGKERSVTCHAVFSLIFIQIGQHVLHTSFFLHLPVVLQVRRASHHLQCSSHNCNTPRHPNPRCSNHNCNTPPPPHLQCSNHNCNTHPHL